MKKQFNRSVIINTAVSLCLLILSVGCTVSYKLNGASIDYLTTKTIQIDDFPLRSAYVW